MTGPSTTTRATSERARLAREHARWLARNRGGRLLERLLRRRVGPGVWAALVALAGERRIAREHRAAVRKASAYAGARGLRINVGCGPRLKEGWVNLDLVGDETLHLDLRRPLPFADGSAEIVYGEHVFEHLAFPEETSAFLAECLRVLAPGGRLSLVVPDTPPLLRAVADRDEEWLRVARERWHPDWCRFPLDQLNYHFRQDGEHKWAWDEESLVRAFEDAGFADVHRRGFDAELDSEERREGSLAVDGAKR